MTESERPDADVGRDASSKPAEILAFWGIAPGMTVFDMNSAGGYFAEILSRAVGPAGRVIAHNDRGAWAALGAPVFEQRYGGDRLPNVELLFVRHNEIELEPASLDGVLMSLVYHDTYWYSPSVDWGPVDRQALLSQLSQALKPGGTILVVDHRAPSGADPARSAVATHRIDPAVVRRDFAAAGFELAAESDLFANPRDAHDLEVFDARVHGNTDRFAMLFRARKPDPPPR